MQVLILIDDLPHYQSSEDEPPAIPEPRAHRANVMLSATVEYFGGGTPTTHRVRDLSSGGIRLDQAGALRVGATVLISVGILEAIGATVRWVKDDRAGLEFAVRIDPEHARTRAPAPAAQIAAMPPAQGSAASLGAGWVANMQSPYRT